MKIALCIGNLASNKNLAGLDINRLVKEIQGVADSTGGKIDFDTLSGAISKAVQIQFQEKNIWL